MFNNINELRSYYRDCIIHAFGEMLCGVYTAEDFKKYWGKFKEIALKDLEYPSGNLKIHKQVDYYYPWFQKTEFGILFMQSCFIEVISVCIGLIRQKIITTPKELEEFFTEVEDRFLELIRDENVLFKTLSEIDEQIQLIKWDL
jgi:hypothetical protein